MPADLRSAAGRRPEDAWQPPDPEVACCERTNAWTDHWQGLDSCASCSPRRHCLRGQFCFAWAFLSSPSPWINSCASRPASSAAMASRKHFFGCLLALAPSYTFHVTCLLRHAPLLCSCRDFGELTGHLSWFLTASVT